MKVLVDDEKDFLPDGTVPDLIIRNYGTAYMLLDLIESSTTDLYLDHDLGEEKTGYDLITLIEKDYMERRESPALWFGILPAKIVCVSNNPPGRARIEQVIGKLYGS